MAIHADGFEHFQHQTYLLLTEAAVQAVRVVDQEYFEQYCAVRPYECYLGTYNSEDEAFDGLEWPEDEVVPATKCPDGHLVEWDERYSPPPPPNHP